MAPGPDGAFKEARLSHVIWRTGPDGAFLAESGNCHLLVQATEAMGGAARFMVLRRGHGELPDALIGSGTAADLRTAMA